MMVGMGRVVGLREVMYWEYDGWNGM